MSLACVACAAYTSNVMTTDSVNAVVARLYQAHCQLSQVLTQGQPNIICQLAFSNYN